LTEKAFHFTFNANIQDSEKFTDGHITRKPLQFQTDSLRFNRPFKETSDRKLNPLHAETEITGVPVQTRGSRAFSSSEVHWIPCPLLRETDLGIPDNIPNCSKSLYIAMNFMTIL
jgi:hypothetical protein